MSADAMRAYIRRRRDLLGYTQEGLAKAIGVPYPTYRDFESGATRELKASLFARVVEILNIPIEHIKKLGKEISLDEAGQLATDVLSQEDYELKLTPEQRTQVNRIQAKLWRVTELGEQDPEKLEHVIERLRADAHADPALLDLVMAYLDGRRSRPS